MSSFIVGCVLFSLTWQLSSASCDRNTGICLTDEINTARSCKESCSRKHSSCHGLIDRFGKLGKFRCHCNFLGDCDFQRNGSCGGAPCLPSHDGITCQIRLYHHFLDKIYPYSLFSDTAKNCQSLPSSLKFNYKYRIHTIIFHNLKRIPTIEGTDFKCQFASRSVICKGDVFTNNLKISSAKTGPCVTRIELKGCPPTLYGATCTLECRCKNDSWCHQWTGACEKGCEDGYLGKDCQDTSFENIALGRETSQSSTFGHHSTHVFTRNGKCEQKSAPMFSSYAVDGNFDNEYEHRSCTKTYHTKKDWWKVKFEKPYNLTQLRMYNRNTKKDRLWDVIILVNSGVNGAFVKAYHSPYYEYQKDIIYARFSKPYEGDTLQVFGHYASLTLCEVEVIKCKHGYYGYLCTKICSRCVNKDCEDFDGHCTIACLDGYSWDNNNKTCKDCNDGNFGFDCSKTCNCNNDDICNAANGACPRGCRLGFGGVGCQDVCKPGTYGISCSGTCNCRDDVPCNILNGNCSNGCEVTYKGADCQTPTHIIEIYLAIAILILLILIAVCFCCWKLITSWIPKAMKEKKLRKAKEKAEKKSKAEKTKEKPAKTPKAEKIKEKPAKKEKAEKAKEKPEKKEKADMSKEKPEKKEKQKTDKPEKKTKVEDQQKSDKTRIPESKEKTDKARRPESKEERGKVQKAESKERTDKARKPESKEERKKARKPGSRERPDIVRKPESRERPEMTPKPESRERPATARKPESKERRGAARKRESEEEREIAQRPEIKGERKKTRKPESKERPETALKPDSKERPETAWRAGSKEEREKVRKTEKKGRPGMAQIPEIKWEWGKAWEAETKERPETTLRAERKEEREKAQRADIKDLPEEERRPVSKARPFTKERRDKKQKYEGKEIYGTQITDEKEGVKTHISEKRLRFGGTETFDSKIPGKTEKTERTQISEHKQIPDYFQIPGKTKEARKIQILEDKQTPDNIKILAKTPRTGKIHTDYFQTPETSQKSMILEIPDDKQLFGRRKTPQEEAKTWKMKLPGFKRLSKLFQKRGKEKISEDREISEEISEEIFEESPKAEFVQSAENLSKHYHISEYGLIPKRKLSDLPKDHVNFEDEVTSIYRPVVDPPIMKYIKKQLRLHEPFLDDFLMLPKGLIYPCKAASKTVNTKKNRNKFILPYDHSRVILRPDDTSYSDYINASYLNNRKYIITQGPLKETVVDFWRMIYQQECSIIIMFPEYDEKGKIKDIQYWPDVRETEEYGLMKIKAMDIATNAIYEKRTFHIVKKELQKTESWEVNHFTFLKWPGLGVPIDTEYILDFRNTVTSVFNKKLPIVVQSSNGVGRSGVYVCIDTLLNMDFKKKAFDPMLTIQSFRDDRAFIIENRSQLEFIYRALADGIITEQFTFRHSKIERQYEGLKKQNSATRTSNFEEQFQDVIRSIKPFTIEEYRKSIESSLDATTILDMFSEDTVFIDGYMMSNELILMKSPKYDMTGEFFNVIFQTQCPVIVAFTNSCQDTLVYIPSKVNSKIGFGKFTIELLTSLDLKEMYVHRVLKLSSKERKNAAELIINHFQVIIWPDKSYPSPDKIASFITLLNRGQDQKYQKVAVHGSDGFKKSGLFCVLYSLLNKMSNEKFINIVRLIRLQKKRSPYIVADYKSYQYCWKVANYYNTTFSLYSKC